MAKYFCGIAFNENKYSISIIDDNLNIIFLDKLEIDKLSDLLKRKSVTTISIDAPIIQYVKQIQTAQDDTAAGIKIKRRSFDNILSSKGLLTYQDRFNVNSDTCKSIASLYVMLNKLGFSVKKAMEPEKAIIESYPDTSFFLLGFHGVNIAQDEMVKRKSELLKNKGIRIKDYLKRDKKNAAIEENILMQAYTAYLYFSGDCTALGSADDGIIALPGKDILNKVKPGDAHKLSKAEPENKSADNKVFPAFERSVQTTAPVKNRGNKIITEYCGAQYLYTNIDGMIRINDLRPIKSYRPFTEIYEVKTIKQVQVIMCTTDGLRKVKANLIPYSENTNILKAADDEDKKKLDSFWGNHGDKRGYLIKFNRVDVIKA